MLSLEIASEEAARRRLANVWFVQEGAAVEETADGFVVIVTGAPPGKPQRVEVEFPWPEGADFPANGFLKVDYRLRDAR